MAKLDLSLVHKDSRLSREDLLRLKKSPRCYTTLEQSLDTSVEMAQSTAKKGFECTFANTSAQEKILAQPKSKKESARTLQKPSQSAANLMFQKYQKEHATKQVAKPKSPTQAKKVSPTVSNHSYKPMFVTSSRSR